MKVINPQNPYCVTLYIPSSFYSFAVFLNGTDKTAGSALILSEWRKFMNGKI
jgi:hypothetical protein